MNLPQSQNGPVTIADLILSSKYLCASSLGSKIFNSSTFSVKVSVQKSGVITSEAMAVFVKVRWWRESADGLKVRIRAS